MQYFKHLSSMRNDPKIKRVIAKYGLEGYGLYNLMLESIAGSVETNNPMPFLEETCEDIAMFYNGNSAKIEEMVKYMIAQGLFSVETVEKKIACFKIYKYFEQSQTRSEKIRELIAEYRKQVDAPQMSVTNLIEENRREENIKEKTADEWRKYGSENNVLMTDAQYRKFQEEMPQPALDACIEELSTAKAMKGYKYKRDDLAIRKWVIETVKSKRPDLFQPKKSAEKTQFEIDMAAMLEREYGKGD